jgi:hypothetical protein
MTVECKCSWRAEGIDDRKMAEVIADRHEAQDVRRPHRHDTRILIEAFANDYKGVAR